MSIGLFGTASSALLAAYTQLQTTAHNIANVNTPGYSRQEVLLTTAGSSATDAGFVGRGVSAAQIQRHYDEFLSREVVLNTAQQAADAANADVLDRIDAFFSDPESGIGAAYDDFQSALVDIASRPSDLPARSALLSRADALASRVRATDQRFETMTSEVDRRIDLSISQINTTLGELAKLNKQISVTANAGGTPNDYLDQRDALIERLNGQIGTNAFLNQDGTATIFAVSGQALVLSDTAVRLATRQDPNDASARQVVAQAPSGLVAFEAADLGGGALLGLIHARSEEVPALRARVGQMAAAIAAAYNNQQSNGVDLSGRSGDPMFSIGKAESIAAGTNQGNAQFTASVTDGTAVAASDYLIDFDGSQYTVTRKSDSLARNFASLPATLDGLSIALSTGSPAAGDHFTLRTGSVFASTMQATLTSARGVAAALPVSAETGAANQGSLGSTSLKVTGPDPNQTAAVTLTFTSPTTFDVSGPGTGNLTNVAYQPNQPISFNGWTLVLSGTPAAGDTVAVGANRNIAADNGNIRAMADLSDSGVVDGSSVTSAYADLLGEVGVKTSAANSAKALSTRMLDSAKAARSTVSGVNLDEEAAHLLQYQQAYQAAAKVMSTAQEMFQSLLQSTGG